MAQSRNWIFTINNPGDLKPEVAFAPGYKYLIYQLEQGEEGTPHYQGYVAFKSNKRLAALKKLSKEAHWEPRRGSHSQARDYCSKEETRVKGPWTFGVEPEQGKRTDLDEVKEAIDAGASMADVAQNFFSQFVKYERGFRSYINTKATPRDFKTKVYVCYGPTGTGKSMYAANTCKDPYWYFPQPDGKWWDGYQGQEDVIIDEFYGQILWSTLLRLLDRYPLTVEVKGGTHNFAPKRIFITSNKQPIEWYPNKVEQFSTLGRRLDYIMNFPTLGQAFLMNPPPPPPLPPFLSTIYANEDTSFINDLLSVETTSPPLFEIPMSPPKDIFDTTPEAPQSPNDPGLLFPRSNAFIFHDDENRPTKIRRLE